MKASSDYTLIACVGDLNQFAAQHTIKHHPQNIKIIFL